MICQHCGQEISDEAVACVHCGQLVGKFGGRNSNFATTTTTTSGPRGTTGPRPSTRSSSSSSKSKTVAGVLAILLGGIGAHHFYLGRMGKGIISILFSWTFIPAIVGIVNGIQYLTCSDDEFESKYVDR